MATIRINADTLANITIELFQQGRRTVSYEDWQHAYGREHDHTFNNRVVSLLLDVVKKIQNYGIPCTPVNDYCLRHFADDPVTTEVEARRCNVFNSGGKPPVGIRRALPDDLGRGESHGSQAHLGLGNIRAAVQQNVNDVAQGVTQAAMHTRLVSKIQNEVPQITAAVAESSQSLLPD